MHLLNEDLIDGNDGISQVLKLGTADGVLTCPIRRVYPHEIKLFEKLTENDVENQGKAPTSEAHIQDEGIEQLSTPEPSTNPETSQDLGMQNVPHEKENTPPLQNFKRLIVPAFMKSMLFETPPSLIEKSLLIFVTFFVLYGITSLLQTNPNDIEEGSFKSTWVHRLILNLVGYSTVFIPGYLIFKYVRLTKFLERSGGGCLASIVEMCVVGREIGGSGDPHPDSPVRSLRQDALLLMFCFVGLQGSYLTWGILQEKIMTQKYTNSLGQEGSFKDSQFLVFMGRVLAFSLSGSYLILRRQPKHTMPLYKYAYCSFSNIMSSWCQYEALKYISFPSQVLAKACKIIPVMLMGKVVSKEKYEYYEYVTAVLISIGMTFFMLSSAPSKDQTVTTLSGVILLASYLMFDSFTSNWQGALFKQYKVSPIQMMCGVNLFSFLFTAVSLFQQGAFSVSLQFMATFPKFAIDCILLAMSSGAGQLFIFFTISCYGPVVFVIIMTIRQGLAILLSCLIYQHSITSVGVLGVVMVFSAIFLRIYCNQRLKVVRRIPTSGASKV